jgi:hypothetical protein
MVIRASSGIHSLKLMDLPKYRRVTMVPVKAAIIVKTGTDFR